MTAPQPVDDRTLHQMHTEEEIDDGSWECTDPEAVQGEPWEAPECASCGHKLACCQNNHYMCDCDDDEDDEYL